VAPKVRQHFCFPSTLGGKGPDSSLIEEEGKAYLHAKFPKLDYIKTARLVEGSK
jgi:hypothetical protein